LFDRNVFVARMREILDRAVAGNITSESRA
jgi:hypothetical protein